MIKMVSKKSSGNLYDFQFSVCHHSTFSHNCVFQTGKILTGTDTTLTIPDDPGHFSSKMVWGFFRLILLNNSLKNESLALKRKKK